MESDVLLDALIDPERDWDRLVEGRGWMKTSQIIAELRSLLKREEPEVDPLAEGYECEFPDCDRTPRYCAWVGDDSRPRDGYYCDIHWGRPLNDADTPPAAERDHRAMEKLRETNPLGGWMLTCSEGGVALRGPQTPVVDGVVMHEDPADAILACTEDGANAATETANVPHKSQEEEK